MASGEFSSIDQKKLSQGFSEALASAVLEWLLIFFLFIDALFSYLITKFACYCGLQTPCLLCSRIDHVLGSKKVGFYWDMICGNHKLEISSLVLCRAHNKLVDVHGMCENCLFSFATINKSNAETYTLLVGKLGDESEIGLEENIFPKGHNLCNSSAKCCSCCDEPCISKGFAKSLMLTKSTGCELVDLDVPLSGNVGSNHYSLEKSMDRLSRGDSLRKIHRDDLLSHVGYTKLNITSDTESDSPFSDDDEMGFQHPKTVSLEEESLTNSAPMEPQITFTAEDSNSVKIIDPASLSEPSPLTSSMLSDVEPHGNTFVPSTTVHGDCEVKCIDHDISKINAAADALTELISFDDTLSAAKGAEMPKNVITESCVTGTNDDETKAEANSSGSTKEESGHITAADKSETHPVTEHISQASNLFDLGDAYKIAVGNRGRQLSDVLAEHWLAKDSSRISEDLKNLFSNSNGTTKEESGHVTAADKSERHPLTEHISQTSNLLDLGDAYKIAVGNRGRQLSDVLAEHWLAKDSSRVSEDLKNLFSQLSASRGFEQSLNDMSPKLSVNSEELRSVDTPNSTGFQALQKRISLERNESGLESLDGSIVSEIEGESVVDRLKRQIEHDRRLMNALYKELEEERNASAVAANQAMAMITRLQEEKAALHMESLHYLREMEEQAEYDMEALQKSNELLAEREKETQDLEAELEFYRSKFSNESLPENIMEPIHSETSCSEATTKSDRNVLSVKAISPHKICHKDRAVGEMRKDSVMDSKLEIEEEKLHILQCLKMLDQKLGLCPHDDSKPKLDNDEFSGNERGDVCDSGEEECKPEKSEDGAAGESSLSMQTDVSQSKLSSSSQEVWGALSENVQSSSEECEDCN